MILVLVGTNPYSFHRLVFAMDALVIKRGWKVFVQLGNTSFVPCHCAWERFVEQEHLISLMDQAELIVCQGGFGSIRDARAMGKKVVAVPRRPDLGESVDDQSVLVRKFERMQYVLGVYDIDNLESAIDQSVHMEFKPAEPSRIPSIIQSYLKAL